MHTTIYQHWYKEPWVWFNIVLLTTAIACASIMTIISIKHTPAEIGNYWYKDGVLANRERDQESIIRKLQLRGELHLAANGQIEFREMYANPSHQDEEAKRLDVDTLKLHIDHPTNPNLDQTILLKRHAPFVFRGKIEQPIDGKRHLLISPLNDSWYLTSEVFFPTRSTVAFLPNYS